jgi:Ca2+-binding EF-hand superfamily protein
MIQLVRRTCVAIAALALLISAGNAAPPAAKPQAGNVSARTGWLDPMQHYARLRESLGNVKQPEIVEMLMAIAHGSDMGPGDGWFHGSTTRYDWKWLASHFDANRDGTITRQEFKGPAELFDRLDRNHDGVLTAGDFDWSDRSLYAMQGMPARMWFSMIDSNGNGRISQQEWEALFKRAARAKGYLTPDDLREMFPVSPPARPVGAPPPSQSGPSVVTLLKGLLDGELGSPFEGPSVGQSAPDFRLRTPDGKREVQLSQFKGKKPVVLVFGSFT